MTVLINFIKNEKLRGLQKKVCNAVLVTKNAKFKGTPYKTYIAQMIFDKNIEDVKLLLDAGVDPNIFIIMDKKIQPLHFANIMKPEMLKLFIQAGADINAQDWMRRSPLLHADDPEIAEILLKNGANPNIQYDGELMVLDYYVILYIDTYLMIHMPTYRKIYEIDILKLKLQKLYKIILLLLKYGANVSPLTLQRICKDTNAVDLRRFPQFRCQ